MNSDKHLDTLFEKAKNEAPKLSFEQTAQKFNASVSLSTTAMLKAWLTKYITLNTVSLFTVSSLLLVSAIFVTTYENKNPKKQTQKLLIDTTTTEQSTQNQEKKLISKEIKKPTIRSMAKNEKASTQNLDNQNTKPSYKQKKKSSNTKPKLVSIESIDVQQTPELQKQHLFKEDEQIKNIEIPKATIISDTQRVTPQVSQHRKEVVLIIKRGDTEERVKHFMVALEGNGFTLSKSRFHRKEGYLNHLFLWFKHAKGLNFKLKGTGFQKLEIKIFNDEKGNLKSFIYRFNQEEFSKEIPLICKGYKTHMYGDGFQGVSGRTNINISNEKNKK